MKCPCCQQEFDGILAHYFDRKLFYEGKTYTLEPAVGRLFMRLLEKPLTTAENRGSSFFVTMSRLRRFLLDERIPLYIPHPQRRTYRMVPAPNVKNDNPSQHSQDVHS